MSQQPRVVADGTYGKDGKDQRPKNKEENERELDALS